MIPKLSPVTVTVREDFTILDLFERDAANTISETDKRKLDEWCLANAAPAPRHSGCAPSQSSLSRPSGECQLSQGANDQ